MRPLVSIRILVVLPEVEKFNFCLSQWQKHYKHELKVWLKEENVASCEHCHLKMLCFIELYKSTGNFS